jgi:hypothetical protein
MFRKFIKKILPQYFIHKLISFFGFITFEKQRNKLKDEWLLYKIDNNKFTLIKSEIDYEKLLLITKLIVEDFDGFTPGLYRLINPSKNINKQFLIKSNSIIDDMKNMMFIFIRGDTDSYKSFNSLYRKSMKKSLVMTCGHQATFMLELIKKYYRDIKVRKIYFLTCEKFNHYNDGHVAIEIFDKFSNKWLLVDLMRDVMYKNVVDNRYLSAFELIESSNSYKLERFSKSIHFDISFKRYGFEYNFFEQLSYSDIGHEIFTGRVLQSLIIPIENLHYCYILNNSCKSNIKLLYGNTLFLHKSDFIKKFYYEGVK